MTPAGPAPGQPPDRQRPERQRPERGARLRGLTVQGWFRLVFAAFALLLVVAAVIIIELLARGRAVSNELEFTVLPAQAQAYRLQGGLIDQETGVRGYGITGDARFLQPYTSGQAVEASAAARLRALIGADHPLAADLASLQRAAQGWRSSDATPLIARARHGPLGGRDLALLDQSKRAFDNLRVLSGVQNAHLAAAVARDHASLQRFRAVQDWAFAAILVALLLASAALTLVLRQTVVRPLNRLRAASRWVVDGEFGHQIEATGPADLRAVAADIEEMRSGLVTALESARTAEQVAARQAADLDMQAAELRRSNAELEQFAYVASHDLQEPLRKVASFCQLLEKRYSAELDDRGRQYIGFAVDGAKRLQILINDLLTFSRVGRSSGAPAVVALDQALDAAIADLDSAIEECGAVIERPDQLPEVNGYATLLAMLWQNLVGNAIKFRSPGRPPLVRVTVADAPDGKWEFCVTDNGIGIAPEFSEKVFVIFQRLHGRESYPGTGIGLALCKRIIEQHGGDISLDTDYADGTRICFTLPRIEAAGPDQADDSASHSASHSASDSAESGAETSTATRAEGIPA